MIDARAKSRVNLARWSGRRVRRSTRIFTTNLCGTRSENGSLGCRSHSASGYVSPARFAARFRAYRLRLSRQQRPLGIGKSDSPSAQSLFEQPILSLEKFDDDQPMSIDTARYDHQQKRQQRRHGTLPTVYRGRRFNCWTLRATHAPRRTRLP